MRPDGTVGPGVNFSHVSDFACPDHPRRLAAYPRSNSPGCPSGWRPYVCWRLPSCAAPPRPCASTASACRCLPCSMHQMAAACMKSGMVTMTCRYPCLFVEYIRRKSLYRACHIDEHPRGLLVVDIAKRNDVLCGAALDVTGRLASRADGGDIEFLVGRFVAQSSQGGNATKSRDRNRAGQQWPEKEMSSGSRLSWMAFVYHMPATVRMGSRSLLALRISQSFSASSFGTVRLGDQSLISGAARLSCSALSRRGRDISSGNYSHRNSSFLKSFFRDTIAPIQNLDRSNGCRLALWVARHPTFKEILTCQSAELRVCSFAVRRIELRLGVCALQSAARFRGPSPIQPPQSFQERR